MTYMCRGASNVLHVAMLVVQGNQEYNFDHCVMDETFKVLVANQWSGFEWTDEHKPNQKVCTPSIECGC